MINVRQQRPARRSWIDRIYFARARMRVDGSDTDVMEGPDQVDQGPAWIVLQVVSLIVLAVIDLFYLSLAGPALSLVLIFPAILCFVLLRISKLNLLARLVCTALLVAVAGTALWRVLS